MDECAYRLAYIHAAPLTDGDMEIAILDTNQELDALKKILASAHRRVHLRTEIATAQNLRTLLTMGSVMVHYSGHGTCDALAFENQKGELHKLDADSLKLLFQAGSIQTKITFVSACYSEEVGRKFADAGIPHVVAVKRAFRVTDNASRIFAENFYISLLNGLSVRQSFDVACNLVKLSDKEPAGECKFLLLPEGNLLTMHAPLMYIGEAHDAKIFESAPYGEYVEESQPLAFNGCDSPPLTFVGRNHDMRAIYALFNTSQQRCVTIRGSRGIGKTALALRVCGYMNERRLFGAIFFAPLSRYEAYHDAFVQPNYLAQLLALAMGDCGKNINNLDDLVKTLQQPLLYTSSNVKRQTSTAEPILFVLDGCDAFMPSDDDIRAAEMNTVFTPRGNIMVPPTDAPKTALFHVITTILRKTSNVKFLLTAENSLQRGGHILVNAPEKIITLGPLGNMKIAELLVMLCPRGVRASEMNGVHPQLAMQHLSNRPIIASLEGNPRATVMFAAKLSDNLIEDSPEMLAMAATCVARAREWRESHAEEAPLEVPFASRKVSGSPSSSNGSDIPVAVPVDHVSFATLPPRVERKHSLGSNSKSTVVWASAANVPPPKLTRPKSTSSYSPLRTEAHLTYDQALTYANRMIPDMNCAAIWAEAVMADNNRKSEVSWPSLSRALINAIQKQYLSPDRMMQRTLSNDDMNFLLQKLLVNPIDTTVAALVSVNIDKYLPFSNWLSSLLQTIRILRKEFSCQSPILIHGFLTRVQAERRLRGTKKAGVFLLRFSETHAGRLVVSFTDYVDDTSPSGEQHKLAVHHCLVDVTDTGLSIFFENGADRYNSLSELILKCSNLLRLFPDHVKSSVFSSTTAISS